MNLNIFPFIPKHNHLSTNRIRSADEHFSEEQLHYWEHKKRSKILLSVYRILFFLLFISLWEVGAFYKHIDTFFFSSPSRIWNSFVSGIQNQTLLYHIGVTLLETLASFLIILVISLVLSGLFWFFQKSGLFFEPFLVVLNSLPKSALAPLIIVWFGTGMKTIILCGISVAIFGAILSIYHGFCQTDSEKEKLILTLGGTRKTIFQKVVLPGSIPLLLSVAKVNIGLCLVGVVIGEFLAGRQGLGYLIIYGSQVFQLHLVIMSIIILCIIAMGLYQIIKLLEKHVSSN